jgi:Bacteriophage head to tail connecting protein
MKARARELIEQGDRLFSRRAPLLSLWQTTAEQFYPLRADFTAVRSIGEEFASHLMTGRPMLVHRELSNAFSSMLRPRGKVWFRPRSNDERINQDAASRAWLDNLGEVMTRAMYDRPAQFVRATKQGDADFAAFGQTVISVDPNRDMNGLLYRNWHLRDCVWCENAENKIDVFHRDYKIEARDYVRLFPKAAAQSVKDCVEKDPYREVKCRHIVLPSADYDLETIKNKDRFPFVSLYIDIENSVILEEVPRKRLGYVIPRWVTIAGSQYAYSPATVIALPDARMLQNISLTLLEAGQKAVDPPLKVTKDVIGTVNTYPGGLTWVDEEYDERLGPAIEPIMGGNPPALAWGERKEQQIETMLADMFFLSKLSLPPAEVEGDMTKWEAQQRVEEYIRGALPLFEPMEIEYNGGLCEETFEQCMDLNMFGPMNDLPPALFGQKLRWQFESPLQEAHERAKAQAFMQVANLTQTAAVADPTVMHDVNIGKAFRDAVTGTGAPAEWLVPEQQAQEAKAQAQRAALAQSLAATIGTGADVAGKVGAGIQQLQQAGIAVPS